MHGYLGCQIIPGCILAERWTRAASDRQRREWVTYYEQMGDANRLSVSFSCAAQLSIPIPPAVVLTGVFGYPLPSIQGRITTTADLPPPFLTLAW